MRFGGLLLGFALAGVAGTGGATAAPVAATQPPGAGGLLRLPADAIPRPPDGAVRLGRIAPGTPMRLDVTLNVRDPAALKAFIAGLSDRRSRFFGHFLKPGQFGRLFGPDAAEISAVRAALRTAGLDPGRIAPDRLAVAVTGTAAAVERAFSITVARYRLPGGRLAYANSSPPHIPAAIAADVNGVLGLSDLYLPRSLTAWPRGPRPVYPGLAGPARLAAAPGTAGPRPCAAVRRAARRSTSYTASQLASHYAMSPLFAMGDRGQGIRVALAEFEPDSPRDISAYRACYKIRTRVRYVRIDGGAGSGHGIGEAALDIEDTMGLAPAAAIDVYQAPKTSDADTYDVYSAIINDDADQVVSTSWGVCEPDSGAALIRSEHNLFAQAASQGQTVFAASGDEGSTDCNGDGTRNARVLSVDDPAGQPYVVGVGGTSIGARGERVWNDSLIFDGAGGGGLSGTWCMPGYQDHPGIPGLISRYSHARAAECGTRVPYARQVPDVAADADPQHGYLIRLRGSWQAVGGTSAAAPLWAAAAALIDASPFCRDYVSHDPGVLPQGLYATVSEHRSYVYSPRAEVLGDVTRGGNDYTPSGYTGGRYPATRGYDMASGLGTPLLSGYTAAGKTSTFYPGLAASMCWTYGTRLRSARVTALSRRQGPGTRRVTITVSGTGFLPVPGADRAEVGRTWVSARCTTSTRCTVRLPRRPPGTVNIRISAEDLTLSPVTGADRYRFT